MERIETSVTAESEKKQLAHLLLNPEEGALPLGEIVGPAQVGAETVALLALRRRNPGKTQDITL